MALTQKQILDNTPGVVKLRTKICSIRLVGAGKHIEDKKLGKCYELLYSLRCLDGNRYVKIRYIGSKKPGLGEDREQNLGAPSEDSEVWVSCTCPYHMYTTEYALARAGSSSILFGNGEPARLRNPDNIGYVCKHAVLALMTAVKDEAAKPPPEPQQKSPTNWRTRLKNWLRGKDPSQETPADQDDNPPNERQPVQQPQQTQQQPQQRSPVRQPVQQPQEQQDAREPVKQPQQPERNTTQQKPEDQENQQTKKPSQRSWKERLTDWLTGKK